MLMRARRRRQHSCFACGSFAGVCLRAVAGLRGRVYALRCSFVDETEQ